MVFFEGALGYTELKDMPLIEIVALQVEAQRIAALRKRKA